MSSSSSSTPVDIKSANSENKYIRTSLFIIWGLLILFGFISLLQPAWLTEISSDGKISEASDYLNLGNTYLQKRKFKLAAGQYQKAIKIQSDLTNAYGNLGICYTQLNRYDDAIKIFKYLLKTENENVHTNYYNLADIYKRQGDVNSAIECYLKSAEINPYPIYSYQYLGELYLKLEKWDLAAKAFELAVTNKLTFKNSYYGMLKNIKNLSGEEPETLAAVESFLSTPVNPNLYDQRIFDFALNKNREMAKTFNFLGFAYSKKMDFAAALANYEIALKIWPKYSEAKQNLKSIKQQLKFK